VRSHLDGKLWQRCLRLLSKICKAQGIIPDSYILRPESIRVGRVQDHGGFSEVSDGEYLGYTVAIKDLRVNEGDFDKVLKVCSINPVYSRYSTFNQRFCREIVGWKHLSHPNVLPLLGVSISNDPHCFRILSEWMPNGNLMSYTRSNPKENRLRLVSLLSISPRFLPFINHPQLYEVSSGVAYLHRLGIAHGDLKGVTPTHSMYAPATDKPSR
jgi:serine/threonine protein kinase